MPINIGGLSSISPGLPTSTGAGKSSGGDFGAVMKQVVGSLGQLGARADASTLAMAKGDPVDVHEVMLNTEQASLGFSMALQVRNKLVDAYQEVMRMSV